MRFFASFVGGPEGVESDLIDCLGFRDMSISAVLGKRRSVCFSSLDFVGGWYVEPVREAGYVMGL